MVGRCEEMWRFSVPGLATHQCLLAYHNIHAPKVTEIRH